MKWLLMIELNFLKISQVNCSKDFLICFPLKTGGMS